MKTENRKQEWAVLLDDCKKLSKGEKITVQVVTSCAMHGGGYLETNINIIKVSEIKELAPNMVIVQSVDTDYYMYNYNLSGESLCFPLDGEWIVSDTPITGSQMSFTRRRARNHFLEESFMTNPVFKIQMIHPNLLIAWCKDRERGNNIGYVIEMTCPCDAPTENYFWIWDVDIPRPGFECSAKICVDLQGKRTSAYVTFVPKRGKHMGNWTLIEAEDGNFYIWQYPFNAEWIEK